MIGYLGGDVGLNEPLSRINNPNSVQYLGSNQALQHVSLCSSFQRPLRQNVARIGRQYNDSRGGGLTLDCNNGIQAAHVRHLQVHQGHIGIELAVKLHSLPPGRRFRDQLHVGLCADQRPNTGTQQRMVIR